MKQFTSQTYIDPNFLLPERVFKATVSEILEIAEKELNKTSRDLTVLDVGSGKGEHTIELARRVKIAIGLEPYKPSYNVALRLKSKSRSKAFFYDTLVEDYKTSKKFDLVICLATVEHMPNAKASFKNIFKILNNGGIIYMTAPNKLWPIEAHYNLPFLNYLPLSKANIYLRITGKGKSFKDSSYAKTYFGMKKFLNQFPCTYYFYLPDPNSPYLGGKGPLYRVLYKVGIFLIASIPIFWAVSKGFIIIIKKNNNQKRGSKWN